MVPMPYTDQERLTLLTLARDSIAHGFQTQQPLAVSTDDFSTNLVQQLSCFVTLTKNNTLRGCIGSLQAFMPLVQHVTNSAHSAAFHDLRFPPLTENEFSEIHIEISILSTAEELTVSSEEELLRKLKPGKDGLILNDGTHSATYLPTVWKQLPTVEAFVCALKKKAGIPTDYWSPSMQVFRYSTELIEE